jgi:hypothetical protein
MTSIKGRPAAFAQRAFVLLVDLGFDSAHVFGPTAIRASDR